MIDIVTGNPYGVNPQSIRDAVALKTALNITAPSLLNEGSFQTGLSRQEIMYEAEQTLFEDGVFKNAPELVEKWGWSPYGDYNSLDPDYNVVGVQNKSKVRSQYLGMLEPAGSNFDVIMPDGSIIKRTANKATVVDPNTGKDVITGNAKMLLALGDPGTVLDNVSNRQQSIGESLQDMLGGIVGPVAGASTQPLYQGFYPVYDKELGKYVYQGFVGTGDQSKKLEAAGQSIVNRYGPKPFSSNVAATMYNGIVQSFTNFPNTWASMSAGLSDIVEATYNASQGEGFTADYDESNVIADGMTWNYNAMSKYGRGSTRTDQGLFDNPIAFTAGLASGIGSLAQYGAAGRVANSIFTKGWDVSKALGKGLAGGAGAASTTEAVAAVTEGSGGFFNMGKNWIKDLVSNPTNLSMMSVGTYINGGEAYQAARQAGLSLEDSSLIGWISGTLMSGIEVGLGANVLTKWAIGGKGSSNTARAIIAEYGGDLSKLNNPINVTNVFGKMVEMTKKVGEYGAIGAGLEEGFEEVAQGFIKNSNEWLFDSIFAGKDGKEKGYFGTNPFSLESMKSYLEEGTIGLLLGIGGGAISSRRDRDTSILPFIARGEDLILKQGVDYAFNQNAISEAQRDIVLKDINNAIALRDRNKDLFIESTKYKPEVRGKVAETLLSTLDAQEDFIKNSDGIHALSNSLDQNDRRRYEDYWNDLEGVIWGSVNQTVTTKSPSYDGSINPGEEFYLPIHTTNSLVKQLESANRAEEAKIVKQAYNDAVSKSNKYVPNLTENVSDSLKGATTAISRELVSSLSVLNAHNSINSKKLDILSKERNDLLSGIPNRSQLLSLQTFYEKSLINVQPEIESLVNEYNNEADEVIKSEIVEEAQEKLDFISDSLEKESDNYANVQNVIPFVDNLIKTSNISLDQRFTQGAIKQTISPKNILKDIENRDRELNAQSEQNKANRINVGPETAPEGNVKTATSDAELRTDTDLARNMLNNLVDDVVVDLSSSFEYSDMSANIKRNKDGSYTYTVVDPSRNIQKIETLTGEEADILNIFKSDLKSFINETVVSEREAYFNFDHNSAENLEPLDSEETAELNDDVDTTGNNFNNSEKLPKADNYKNKVVSDILNDSSLSSKSFQNGTFKLSDTWKNVPDNTNGKREIAVRKFEVLQNVDDFNKLPNDQKNLIVEYLPISYEFLLNGKKYDTYLMDMSSGKISDKNIKYRQDLILKILNSGSKLVKPGDNSIKRTPGYWNTTKVKGPARNSKINDITSLKLSKKDDGKYYHTTKENSDGLQTEQKPLQIGVAARNRVISYWSNSKLRYAAGAGSPGTVYIVIPKELTIGNKDNLVVKTNPQKVSVELAQTVTSVLSDMALTTTDQEGYDTTRASLILPNNRYGIAVDSDSKLSIGEFLNYTVFEGPRTMQDLSGGVVYEHLLNKTLRVVPSLGIIRYGFDRTSNDHYVFNPSPKNPNLEIDRQRFIDWMTTTKNMSVEFAYMAQNRNGSDMVKNNFSVAGLMAKKGDSYISWLVDNGIVKTDLNTTESLLTRSSITFDGSVETIDPIKGDSNIDVPAGKSANSNVDTSNIDPNVTEENTTVPNATIDNTDGTTDVKRSDLMSTTGSLDNSQRSARISELKSVLDKLKTTDGFDDDPLDQFFKIDDISILNTAYNKSDTSNEISHYKRMFKFGGNIKITEKPIFIKHNYFDKVNKEDLYKEAKIRDFVDIAGNSGNVQYAWASMNIDGITLYDGAIEGSLYHEAFHRVSLLYLNNDERLSIYNKAKQLYGLQNNSESEIEEVLAEKFREFALNEDLKTTIFPSDSIIQKFYKSLRRYLKEFIDKFIIRQKLDISTLEGFYNSIWNSAYRFSKPNEDAVQSFKTRYPNEEVYMEIETPNGNISLNQIHDPVTFNKIVSSLTALTLNTNNIEIVGDLKNKISYQKPADVIKALLVKTIDSVVNNESQSDESFVELNAKADMYLEIYNNFNTVFKSAINQQLNYLGLMSKSYEDEMSDREEFSHFDGIKNDEISSAYMYSSKETASTNVKLLFRTLKESSNLSPVTFLPEYADYDTAWFNVLRVTHDANNLDEMISALQSESGKLVALRYVDNPEISKENYDTVNMYSSLIEKLDKVSDNMRTQFWVSFKKHRHDFLNMFFKDTPNGYEYSFGDADIAKRSNTLAKEWSTAFGIDGKYKSSNIESLNKLRKSWFSLYKQAMKDSLGENFEDVSNGLIEIFNALGIDIDSSTLLHATHKFNNVAPMQNLRDFILDKDIYNIDYTIRDFIPVILNKDSIEYGKRRSLNNEQYLLSQKVVRELANDYIAVHPSSEDDSVLGPDGNSVYSYSEYNFITQSFGEYLKDKSYIEQLRSEDINESSIWLRQLENDDVRDNVSVATALSFLQNDTGDKGRDYLEISGVEDVILKMNAVFNNMYPVPVLANKRTYYFIKGLNVHKPIISQNKDNGNLTIDRNTVDLFYNYFLSERTAVIKAKIARSNFLKDVGLSIEAFNNLSEDEQNKYKFNNLVENYHYTINKIIDSDGYVTESKIDLSKGNGYLYRYFKSFESVSEKDLPSFIAPDLDVQTPQYISWQNNESKKIANLKNIIKRTLTKRINDTVMMFGELGIIKTDGVISKPEESLATTTKQGRKDKTLQVKVNVISENNLIDSSYLKKIKSEFGFNDESESGDSGMSILQAITEYAINTSISTIEFDKVVHGDVAFFKNPDDRVKRYSSLSSTGLILNSELPEYKILSVKSNIIKSTEVFNKLYESYIGTQSAPGKLYENYKNFRDSSENVGIRFSKFRNKTDEELFEMARTDAKNRLSGYLNTDQTDGQILSHPEFFRTVNKAIGEWSDEREAAWQLLMSDKELSHDEELKAYTQVIMQPLKLMYFGKSFENGLGVPVYDKASYFTIFKRMVKGSDLEHIYNLMDRNGVQTLQFDSASKSGNRQNIRLYKNNELLIDVINNITPENISKFITSRDFKFLRRQLNTDPHELEKIMLGTQAAKISIAGILDDTVYDINGKQITGKILKDEWNNAINELTDRGFQKLVNDWGIYNDPVSGLTINKSMFMNYLKKESRLTAMPENLISSLKVDSEGQYKVQLSAIPTMKWIQSKVLSKVKKTVIDINTPGGAMIQVSNFGWKDSSIVIETLPKGEISYKYSRNKELSFKDPSNRLEAIVSISLFKQFIPNYRNLTFKEARDFVLNNDISVLGYRIPTQGQNSTTPLFIVDLLPETVGDSIILPSEFTTLTGSDFDIDKLYVAGYNYERVPVRDDVLTVEDQYRYESLYQEFVNLLNWSAKKRRSLIRTSEPDFDDLSSRKEFGNLHGLSWHRASKNDSDSTWNIAMTDNIRKVPFYDDIENKWAGNTTEAVENRLLDIYMSVLTSNEHVIETTTPLDATTKPLKDAVKALEKIIDKKAHDDLEITSPRYQLQIKQQNTGADLGIGPMALANTHQVFTEVVKLSFDDNVQFKDKPNVVKLLNLSSLHRKYDNNGVLIMDWTSALINAHVDAAKDPYILKLNINKYTYSATTMMFRTGVGESTLYFMPQQILKDVANKYIDVFSGKLGVNEELKRGNRWLKPILQEYKSNRESLANQEGVNLNDLPNLEDYANPDHKDGFILDKAWLMKQLNVKESDRDARWYHNQLMIYEYFDQFNEYGRALSDLISATQIDTAKYGKNSSELMIFQGLVDKVKDSPYFINVSTIYDNTFLGKKYEMSVKMLFGLFGKELLEFSPSFNETVTSLLTSFDKRYTRNSSIVNNITDELKSSITSDFFYKHAEFMGYSISDMFFGEGSVVNDYKKLISDINTSDNAELKKLIDNKLLGLLRPGTITTTESLDNGTPMLFNASIGKNRDSLSMNEYTYAWKQLLSSTIEDVQVFAEKLILYAYITSGGNSGGINNFFNMVPFDVLSNLNSDIYTNYNEFVKNTIADGQTPKIFENRKITVGRSLWYNDDIVPSIGYYDKDSGILSNLKNSSMLAEQQKGTAVTNNLPLNIKMTTRFDSVHGQKSFIKFRKQGSGTKQDSVLYRCVGVVRDMDGRSLSVYQLTNKLGYFDKGYVMKEGHSDFLSIIPSNNVNKIDPSISLMDTFTKDIYDPTSGEVFIPFDLIDETISDSITYPTDTVQDDSVDSIVLSKSEDNTVIEDVVLEKPTIPQIQKYKSVNIKLSDDNIQKILSGIKNTTTGSDRQASEIGLNVGESGILSIRGTDVIVTYRGNITIEEAGGKDAILQSEGVDSENDFIFSQTKRWVNGVGKLNVYDFNVAAQTINSEESFDDFVMRTSVDLIPTLKNQDTTEEFESVEDVLKDSPVVQLRKDSDHIIGEINKAVDYTKDPAYESSVDMYNMYDMNVNSEIDSTDDSTVYVSTNTYSLKNPSIVNDVIMIHRSPSLINNDLMSSTKRNIDNARISGAVFKALSDDQKVVDYLNITGADYESITSNEQDAIVKLELRNTSDVALYERYQSVLNGQKYEISDLKSFVNEWSLLNEDERLMVLKDLKNC